MTHPSPISADPQNNFGFGDISFVSLRRQGKLELHKLLQISRLFVPSKNHQRLTTRSHHGENTTGLGLSCYVTNGQTDLRHAEMLHRL